MKVRDVISVIEKDGWVLRRTRGDHRQFIHPAKPGKVTIPGHPLTKSRLGDNASVSGMWGRFSTCAPISSAFCAVTNRAHDTIVPHIGKPSAKHFRRFAFYLSAAWRPGVL
jgi:predicted RNA binding protein YcfA (HicA-like mRNA interferase family)